jgi:hypothetical protein
MDIGQKIKTTGTVQTVAGLRYISSLNSNSNVYCTFYNTIKDTAWDENAGAMGAGATVTKANAAVDCTDHRAVTGSRIADGWLTAVPATIDDGWYDIKYYNNATPADADAILLGRYANIMDGKIQSLGDR